MRAAARLKVGRKVHGQLDQAIRVQEKLLLILSEHSMNSPWVNTEIAYQKVFQRLVKDLKAVVSG